MDRRVKHRSAGRVLRAELSDRGDSQAGNLCSVASALVGSCAATIKTTLC